jgi:hypothetical protein
MSVVGRVEPLPASIVNGRYLRRLCENVGWVRILMD